MRERRGLRGKQRQTADDRAFERAKAAAAAEEAAREAEIDRVDGDIGGLEDFRDRDAGFAGSGHTHGVAELNGVASAAHQHGKEDINSVHWRNVGTGESPVPNFAGGGHDHDARYLNEDGKHDNTNHNPKFAAAGHHHSISFKDLPVATRESIADSRATMALDAAWYDNNGGTWFGGRNHGQVIRTLLKSMLHVYHMVGDTPEYTMAEQNDILETNPNFNFEQWDAQELPPDPNARFYVEDDPNL